VPTLGVRAKGYIASTRSVGLTEAFPRPVVVGYNAIDLPIRYDGSVGTPVSRRQRFKYGGGVHTGALVTEWMKQNPNAIALLTPWVDANQEWLKRYDLPQKPVDVANALSDDNFIRRLLPGRARAELARRVLSEVVERPEGLGPVDGDEYSSRDPYKIHSAGLEKPEESTQERIR
jgi:hypothetical protein